MRRRCETGEMLKALEDGVEHQVLVSFKTILDALVDED